MLTKLLQYQDQQLGMSNIILNQRSPLPAIPIVEMKHNFNTSNTLLNYQRIKKDLIDPSSEETDSAKSRLLYALRQHLPKTNMNSRRNVLNEYVSNDILNIISGKVFYWP